jgi:hypothetical protein
MTANDQIVGRSMKVAIIATALPIVLISLDHFLWLSPSLIGAASTLRRALYFPWIVVETALLAWVAGRFLGVTLFGWIFFLWGEALVGIHAYGASHGMMSHQYASLATTVISAQIGFLVAWAILGDVAVAWRLACGLVAITGVIFLSSKVETGWDGELLPLVQAMAGMIVAGVCLTLRLGRFQMLNLSEGSGSERNRGQVFRFGVKHMLVWTAALAPLMVVLRGLESISLRQAQMVDVYPAGLICACIALITLAAIWLTLGSGMLALRVAVFVSAIGGATLLMRWQCQGWLAQYGPWPTMRMIRFSTEMLDLWGAWFAMLGGLLAALLTFLWAAGYRLARLSPAI